MIKRYKRTNSSWMRRSSRIYLNSLNKNKTETLKEFLHDYSNSINYSITRLWSSDDILDGDLVDKSFTDSIRNRFNTTARLSQCIAKQAKEIVLSQRKKSIKKQRIPRFSSPVANLDSRFVAIEKFNGHFNMCLKFGSGVPKLVVPFNWTKHTNKFISSGWTLGKSIRLGYDNGLFIDLIFEKERPPKRTEGKVIGIDRGFRSMLYSSDGQDIGTELKDKIKTAGKRKKSHPHFITTEENRFIKQLNLTDVKTIVLENLKSVKSEKRGKFSRNVNRLLSFWHYAKVGTRLEQICEELGVSIQYKNPWKTSQRCPECGNIDRRNRNGKRFLCLSCGHQDDADHIGARNLEALGLAEVYSLRSLPSKFNGRNK